jgi:hypothetical protein
MYLLYTLDGTAAVWMESLVFIHLIQLPSNPIIFGFGQLALRCDFSKTKIQPLTLFVTQILILSIDIQQYYHYQSLYIEINGNIDFKIGRESTT